MKKLILLLVMFLISGIWFETGAQLPFYRPTKYKPLKRGMTKSQVKKVQKGKNFYYHNKHGKLKKLDETFDYFSK